MTGPAAERPEPPGAPAPRRAGLFMKHVGHQRGPPGRDRAGVAGPGSRAGVTGLGAGVAGLGGGVAGRAGVACGGAAPARPPGRRPGG